MYVYISKFATNTTTILYFVKVDTYTYTSICTHSLKLTFMHVQEYFAEATTAQQRIQSQMKETLPSAKNCIGASAQTVITA